MEFWSHYIWIMDKNGDLISNPNEKILNNLKEECIEDLEFFLGKLEGRIIQNERNGILIDTALYVTFSDNFNLQA